MRYLSLLRMFRMFRMVAFVFSISMFQESTVFVSRTTNDAIMLDDLNKNING